MRSETWREYVITLKHDKGIVKIKTVSHSIQSAINLVLSAEYAPLEAVRNVKIGKVVTEYTIERN